MSDYINFCIDEDDESFVEAIEDINKYEYANYIDMSDCEDVNMVGVDDKIEDVIKRVSKGFYELIFDERMEECGGNKLKLMDMVKERMKDDSMLCVVEWGVEYDSNVLVIID